MNREQLLALRAVFNVYLQNKKCHSFATYFDTKTKETIYYADATCIVNNILETNDINVEENKEPVPTVENLRKCLVKGEKGYFHQWTNWQDADGLMYPVGIVEDEEGHCDVYNMHDIEFAAWKENN